jgi:inner membrane protein
MALMANVSKSVTVKAGIVGIIVLLLMIPLTMLRGLVSEREGMRSKAFVRVAEGWGGTATLSGPIVIVPTQQRVEEGEGEPTIRSSVYLLPAVLNADVRLGLEEEPRHVGIYEVPVYLSEATFTGRFDFASLRTVNVPQGTQFSWSEARIVLPISQTRSLRQIARAQFHNDPLQMGPAGRAALNGIEAPLDLSEFAQGGVAEFEFSVVVAGSREFSLLPLGSVTTVKMTSNWPHPSFRGAFLPVRRSIDGAGFQAEWQVLELNRPYRQTGLETEVDAAAITTTAFGVGVYPTVDVYQRGERAIKYAMLFIALTFLTFFAWEQISRVRVHPLQYLLVGLALSVFYLLLIALSEHVAFGFAYASAATALIALIGWYIAGAMHSARRGMVAAGAMIAIYVILYLLILSEDYALLLGAVAVFAALGAVMAITRRVDWYRLSQVE